MTCKLHLASSGLCSLLPEVLALDWAALAAWTSPHSQCKQHQAADLRSALQLLSRTGLRLGGRTQRVQASPCVWSLLSSARGAGLGLGCFGCLGSLQAPVQLGKEGVIIHGLLKHRLRLWSLSLRKAVGAIGGLGLPAHAQCVSLLKPAQGASSVP